MNQAGLHEVVNAADVEASLITIKKQNSVCQLHCEINAMLITTDRIA